MTQISTIEFELNKSSGDYIALNQLLKATGLVENGAMANEVIVEKLVKVNGKIDTRKRAKLRVGDKIEFNNQQIEIK